MPCFDGSMRLVGPDGPNTVEGRVEYCSNGVWGTVSDDGFGSRDGQVVCRRLGYQDPSKTPRACTAIEFKYIWHIRTTHTGVQLFESSHFGQGTGPIVFDGLKCDGSESKLEDCTSRVSYLDHHNEDIGIHCYERGWL